MMNKKIASEVASGIILVIAIIVGGSIWFGSKKISQAPATTASTSLQRSNENSSHSDINRDTTLAGPDSNNNNVRDDIDDYITSNYPMAPQRSAAIQTAKAMQEALLVDTADITATKEVNRNLSRAAHCLYSRFDDNNNSKHPALVSQEIEDLTTNTKQRLKAYHSFNKALDGTMWSMPEGNTCE